MALTDVIIKNAKPKEKIYRKKQEVSETSSDNGVFTIHNAKYLVSVRSSCAFYS